jgi:PST family polysaccharide transporter
MTDRTATELSRGALWSAAGTASVQAIALLTSLLTARVLSPAAFGAVGMASVIVVLAATLADLSISPAIAAGRLSDPRAVAGAHWLSCVAGVVGCILLALIAPSVGRFFADARVPGILWVLAPSLVFTGAGVVPQAILQQAGRFRTLALLRAANQGAISLGTVLLVLLGAGVWILVVPTVVASAITTIAAWAAVRRWPGLDVDWRAAARFVREGTGITGHNVCNYLARNADNAIVGKVAGSDALGLYGFAYSLLLRPLELFSHSLTPVLIRSFGRCRQDPLRLSEEMVIVTTGVLRLGVPVMVGGALTCDLFVPLLFGHHWDASIPLVQILMVTGAVQLVGPVFGSMLLATGASRFLLRWGVWTALASTGAFVAGALWAGALGVAFAYLAYTVVAISAMYPLVRRQFSLPLAGLGGALTSLARDISFMTVAVAATASGLHAAGVGGVWRLLAEVVAGALVYTAAFRLFAPREAARLVQALPDALGRRCARLLGLDTAALVVEARTEVRDARLP